MELGLLFADEAVTGLLLVYSDDANIFFLDLIIELLEHTGLNNYAINPKKSKQSPYGLIYNISPLKFEILKTYIETFQNTQFIKPSKSLAMY